MKKNLKIAVVGLGQIGNYLLNELNSKKKASSKKSEDALPLRSLNPALEEKFQLLKDLNEKNLINEKEYEKKRKELLDTYL